MIERQNDSDRMVSYLKVRGWKQSTNPLGEIEMLHPSGEWMVQITPKDGWAAIHSFTDSDIQVQDVGAVATPRWSLQYECESFAELRDELISVGVLPWECPNCGEAGGTPRTAYYSEWQGCAEHGGRVDFEDSGCSKCIKSQEPDYEYREVA